MEKFYTKDTLSHLADIVSVGDYTYGTPNIHYFDDKTKLSIGKFCSIALNVNFILGGNHRTDWISTYPFSAGILSQTWNEASNIKGHPATKGDIIVSNDVWFGYNSIVLSGVKIGNGVVIGAGSVITKDIPDYAIVAGNPARIVKMRFSDEEISSLLKIAWWNWEADKIKENLMHICSNDIFQFINLHS